MTANGHLLAVPDRIVEDFVQILGQHGVKCELEYEKECDHNRYVIDLTSMVCSTDKTQIGVGIEKRRGRNGADIVLVPESRSFFRRDLESEALAEEISRILCAQGASDEPHARCEELG